MAQAVPITPKARTSPLCPRVCNIYHVSMPLRKTLATQHGGNLVARTSRAAELAAVSRAVKCHEAPRRAIGRSKPRTAPPYSRPKKGHIRAWVCPSGVFYPTEETSTYKSVMCVSSRFLTVNATDHSPRFFGRDRILLRGTPTLSSTFNQRLSVARGTRTRGEKGAEGRRSA